MSLASRAVGSALWHVGAGLGGRIVGALGTLVLTHFLAPDVVGEVGVASVLAITTHYAFGAGMGQYMVAHPLAGPVTGFHVTTLNATAVLVSSILLLIFGKAAAVWTNAPGAAEFLPGMMVAVAIGRISDTPERILNRELRFRRVAAAVSGGETIYALVAVGMAARGWGGQSVVVANVARSLFRLGMNGSGVDARAWLCFGPLHRREIAAILRFAIPLQLAALAAFAATKWDVLVISSLFGPAAMGLYALAYNLAQIPADNIGESLSDVLFPSLARLPRARRPEALVRSLWLVALVVFPLAVGLGLVAPTLVAAAFPPRWQPMAPLLTVLSVLGVVHPMGSALLVYLKACERTRAVLFFQGMRVTLLLLALLALGQFGLRAATGAAGLSGAAFALATLLYLGRKENVAVGRALFGLARVLLACVVMGAGVWLARWAAPPTFRPVARLGLEIGAGAATYVASALLFVPAQAHEFVSLLRNLRGRHQVEESAAESEM